MKLRPLLGYILLTALLVFRPATVFAEDTDTVVKTEEELAAEEEQERADSFAADIDTNKLENWPQGPNVYADSAVVMDMDSGAILFGKNADKQHYPASITKLLTTLVALENGDLTNKVKFTDNCVSFLQYDDAQIGMKAGEELSLEDALNAVLLASANEVSYAVAESVGTQSLGGDYQTFIQEMNNKARELGCTNSNWINANGLHDDQHYTSAHDMALIASAVYQQPEFRKIMGTLEYKIGPTNLTQEERVFQQNHRMLWPENYYYYQYCTGGKTGYTDQAKTTLVTMADNGKMHLAAVVLYDYGVDVYTDTQSMLDYVFDHFSRVSIKDNEKSEYIQQIDNSESYVLLPQGVDFTQLEKNISLTEDGIRNGKVSYTYDGQNVGSAVITLTEEGYQKLAGDSKAANNKQTDSKKDNKEGNTSVKPKENNKIKRNIAFGSIAILLILAATFIYNIVKKRKNKR
jgi:D-alanyl-D-alanine carboxypeptidase (penicillin-binding protein 5/6)